MSYFAWQAQYFLHSDAVSRGRPSTSYYLAKVGCHGPPLGGGLLARQEQYFLYSDAVSRGRRSTLWPPMLFRVAGAVLYITLRRSAAVGRRGAAVFLRGRRNTFCTPMLFRVAGFSVAQLHSDAVSRGRRSTLSLPCEGWPPWAAVGLRSSCVTGAIFLDSVIEEIDGLSRDKAKSPQWEKRDMVPSARRKKSGYVGLSGPLTSLFLFSFCKYGPFHTLIPFPRLEACRSNGLYRGVRSALAPLPLGWTGQRHCCNECSRCLPSHTCRETFVISQTPNGNSLMLGFPSTTFRGGVPFVETFVHRRRHGCPWLSLGWTSALLLGFGQYTS